VLNRSNKEQLLIGLRVFIRILMIFFVNLFQDMTIYFILKQGYKKRKNHKLLFRRNNLKTDFNFHS